MKGSGRGAPPDGGALPVKREHGSHGTKGAGAYAFALRAGDLPGMDAIPRVRRYSE